MIYADFNYYLNNYGGTNISDEQQFRRFASAASSEIDSVTFGNVSLSDAVKQCCCEIVDIIYDYESTSGKSIMYESEKVGDYSVKYLSGTLRNAKKSEDIYAIINRRLMSSGMIYRGVSITE